MKHHVDKHVGYKIRHRRWLVGMTQQQLGTAVGIKFQQIQKYESGANRVSASRLWDIAGALGVPVEYFFEGLETDAPLPVEEPGKDAVQLAGRITRLREDQRRSVDALVEAIEQANAASRARAEV